MSVQSVADMLMIAQEGFAAARATNDSVLHRNSLRVAVKAFVHPDAPAFFGGLAIALNEGYDGNDPSIDGNDSDVLQQAGPDEDSPAASPAYEELTDTDEKHDVDGGEGKQSGPDANHVRGITASTAVERAAANWCRLHRHKVLKVSK